MSVVSVARGYSRDLQQQAAELVWEAFRGKLGVALGPGARACAFLERALDPDHALAATDASGELVGIAGFSTEAGGFIGGSISDLNAVYGTFGMLWRGALLSGLERETEPGTLLMDGICVRADRRGTGIGRQLMETVIAEAHDRGCARVRLDVIDGNTAARQLYARLGFVPGPVQETGILQLAYGFKRSQTMLLSLGAAVPR